VGKYVLEFFCPEALVCVEVDGPWHDADRDAQRDAYLSNLGVQTIRIPANELFSDTHIEGSEWVKLIRESCEQHSGRKFWEEKS